MKKHFLLFTLMITCLAYFANAQVIFDPATVDQSKLASGFDVVEIEGESYLRVALNGWGSATPIPNVIIGDDVTSYTCMAKYTEGTSGYTYDQVNTFIKLAGSDWSEINAYGAASSTDFAEHTVSIGTAGTAAYLQIAGQETSTWGSVTGDTIYIGKLEATDGTVSAADPASMEDIYGWATGDWQADVVTSAGYTFNYTDDGPAAGVGGCLLITAGNPGTGSGTVNSLCYREVTLTAGETYTFSGAFKDLTPDGVSNFWCEVGFSQQDPTVEENRVVDFIMGINTWDGCGPQLDGTFEEDGCKYEGSYTVPDTLTGEVTYYLTLLTGNWNNVADTFAVLVDEMSLVLVQPIVTDGNMENADAWMTANWDAGVLANAEYTFNYTDDTPMYGDGGSLLITGGHPEADGSINSVLYQEVTLMGDTKYTFTGAFKDLTPDSVSNFWCEVGLSATDPSVEAGRNVEFFMGINTWDGCGPGLESTFEDAYCKYSGSFITPDTIIGEATYYLTLLTGNWNNVADTFAVLVDEFELYAVDFILVEGVTVNSSSDTVIVGATMQMSSAATPAEADNKTVVWSVEDGTGSATISVGGALTGVSEGTVTVTATTTDGSGVSGSKEITIIADPSVTINSPTGSSYAIFPNPSTGMVTIVTNIASIVDIEVFNMAGAMIMADSFTDEFQLDMTSQSSGLYYIMLRSNENVLVEKLIIR